jgi:hypothetical protein
MNETTQIPPVLVQATKASDYMMSPWHRRKNQSLAVAFPAPTPDMGQKTRHKPLSLAVSGKLLDYPEDRVVWQWEVYEGNPKQAGEDRTVLIGTDRQDTREEAEKSAIAVAAEYVATEGKKRAHKAARGSVSQNAAELDPRPARSIR